MTVDPQHLRLIEAVLFAAAAPMDTDALRARLPKDADLGGLLMELEQRYAGRGFGLVRLGDRWAFRTATDLADILRVEVEEPRKLSRAALETLAIVAYHQPVTRAEIEEIRGVAVSKGTLDLLLELGWVRPAGRRESPGRPLNWATTDDFLGHFGLGALADLPGIEELRAAGLIDARPAIATVGGDLFDAAPVGREEEEGIDRPELGPDDEAADADADEATEKLP